MTKIMMLKIRMVMPMKKDCKNSPNRGPTSICIRLDCSLDKQMCIRDRYVGGVTPPFF